MRSGRRVNWIQMILARVCGWRGAAGIGAPVLVAAACAAMTSPASAQDYPSQTIKIISTVTAGGGLDIFARAYAEELQKRLGQPVIVDPRPGGNFTVAGRACATAPPDGYTICMMTGDPMVFNEFLFAKLPYDPRKDFAPVSMLFFNTMALVVNASLGAKTVDELAAAAKAKPKTMSYIAPRVPEQVFFDHLNDQYGVDFVRVPFRGAGEAVNLMLSDTVSAGFFGSSTFLPYVQAGTMVPLAADGPASLFPKTPTLDQIGYKGKHARMWVGLVVPAGTPQSIIDKLHKASVDIVNDPSFRQKQMLDRGLEPLANTPQEFERYLEQDRIATKDIVKEAGLEPK
jgi:tripartite-type tricarboxylate transporter receptor subunit TctC